MDDQTLFDRQVNGLRAFYRALPSGSPSASAIELDGVHATLFPSAPNRSICNAVNYEAAEQLRAAYDRLAMDYESTRTAAWTIWVPGGDGAAAKWLEHRGHKLDAAPRAMGMELTGFEAATRPDADIDDRIDSTTVGALNDRAYKLSGNELRDSLPNSPDGVLLYGARVDGEYRSCVGTHDNDGDCSIWFVATDPDAQGRGLGGALMIHALLEARRRGCTTTTLQATKAGFPIYARLGYRDLGEMQMWERRAAK